MNPSLRVFVPFLLSRLCAFALSGAVSGILLALALPARGEVAALSYREAPDSFVWELAWDGAAPAREEDLRPDASEQWSPRIRLFPAAGSARAVRFVLEARHAARLHEMDAPEGPVYRAEVYLNSPLRGPSDWTRLEGRQLPHLATPKDHQDAFDVLYRLETGPDGKKKGRLVFQAAHGPAAKAKKAKKPADKGTAKPPKR